MTLTELAQPTLAAARLSTSFSTDGIAAVITRSGEADLSTLRVVVDARTRVIADHARPSSSISPGPRSSAPARSAPVPAPQRSWMTAAKS